MQEPIAVRVIIRGRVQGVGFRHWTARRAESVGLTGWVRNCADGSVEALFVGARGDVEDMLALCRQGPRSASVTSVDATPSENDSVSGFTVRR